MLAGRAQGQLGSRPDLEHHDPRLAIDVEILNLYMTMAVNSGAVASANDRGLCYRASLA